MDKKIKSGLTLIMLFLSMNVFAGVLMQEWTEGTSRFCKYSDGSVEQISFGSTCSSTN